MACARTPRRSIKCFALSSLKEVIAVSEAEKAADKMRQKKIMPNSSDAKLPGSGSNQVISKNMITYRNHSKKASQRSCLLMLAADT
ncbi:MAG: hypothetical protein A2428_10040 [Bdellovibrionales bacterium RIFOXYC1_FULL_54_43]|nr:MAG: hypothetical protein A2428_10040 [Bdellovibrionales bacterium RIFOXYC1_FULL_54_43]OFZ80523.1 MAG: hypothetical protein A2603_13135 [Bdellovibrionales bacterium RIFOXYD1_FULL_55_31]